MTAVVERDLAFTSRVLAHRRSAGGDERRPVARVGAPSIRRQPVDGSQRHIRELDDLAGGLCALGLRTRAARVAHCSVDGSPRALLRGRLGDWSRRKHDRRSCWRHGSPGRLWRRGRGGLFREGRV